MKKVFAIILGMLILIKPSNSRAQCPEAIVDAARVACLAQVPNLVSAAWCETQVEAANLALVHMPFFDWFVMDMGASISRGIQVLMKNFLGDGNEIVAELVYDGDGGGSCKKGGCGGAYTGDNGSVNSGLALNAVASSITDIPAEKGAYPDDVKVQSTDVATLADLRIKQIVTENASLDELSQDKWAILYRAQQRSIQAMTDALVMKKAYKELAAIAGQVSSGSYGNYSEAASTVATRRLLLDALMALRKRVIAARIRARAETMEMDINALSTAPMLDNKETTSPDKKDTSTNPTVSKGDSKPDVKIEDYGLGENREEENASE